MMPPKKPPLKSTLDNTTSSDEFHTVVYESSQLATAILLLQSTEDDVVIKAMAAIMKYAEKSDRNKSEIISLGFLKTVHQLLKPGGKNILKYTCMTCAVLSTIADNRREMRKLNFIPIFLRLLEAETDVGIYEFVTLTLSFMAADFQGRYQILKQNGTPYIVKLLGVHDADVQRNSADILANLLRDSLAAKILEDCGGIPLLLELLKSPHESIQHLSVVCFVLLAERGRRYKGILSSHCLEILLEYLSSKHMLEYQTEILHIITECLSDSECEEYLLESGLTDIILEVMITSDKNDVKVYSIKALLKITQNPKLLRKLKHEDLEKTLVDFLTSDVPALQIVSAELVASLAEIKYWRNAFHVAGGLEVLVKLLHNNERALKLNALTGIANLVYTNSKVCKEVEKLGGLQPIIDFLHTSDIEICTAASACLTNLAMDRSIREEAIRLNAMAGFMNCLKLRDLSVQINCCTAIAAFVCDTEARSQLLANSTEPLVKLMSIRKPEVYLKALWIISTIGVYPDVAIAMCEQGIINFLSQRMKWQSKSNYADLVMERILSTHLPAKYGYLGKLAVSDHIYDVFFDVGPWPLENKFPSLEELTRSPIDEKYPKYLINFEMKTNIGDQLMESAEEVDLSRKSSLSDIAFKPTKDPNLIKYLDYVKDNIYPLNDLVKQIQKLAQFVSQKMGGQVNSDDVYRFTNDLEVTQLKCKYSSNIIPIGSLERGLFRPRALLFKALADQIGIPCTLVRGNLNRVWNEVSLTSKHPMEDLTFTAIENFIVDLVNQPGNLIAVGSILGNEYCNTK